MFQVLCDTGARMETEVVGYLRNSLRINLKKAPGYIQALFLFFLLNLCFAGCACFSGRVTGASFTYYTETRYPHKPANERILLLSSGPPDRAYEEIGVIRVLKSVGCSGNGSLSDQYSDEQALIKKAREVGADGVINVQAGECGLEAGTAIVFKDREH
jgi:hypothetical protein